MYKTSFLGQSIFVISDFSFEHQLQNKRLLGQVNNKKKVRNTILMSLTAL